MYDLEGQLLGEYDQSGQAIREYVWLEHTPVAMFTPDPANPSGAPLVYFIHTDHLNAPRIVVDRSNVVRWRWIAEPFGTTAAETNPSGVGVFTQNLRFPGQYADAESGLFYNCARYYGPDEGRYKQRDPIGLDGGSPSTYSYVYGNPVAYTDPSGEFGLIGFAVGAGLEIGKEMLFQHKSWRCVDIGEVLISGVAGAFSPGVVTLTKSALGTAGASAIGLGFRDLAMMQGGFTGIKTLMNAELRKKPWTFGGESDCECAR